ncbi:MAG TPA: RNA-binding protein, partial [Cytophagales bacterium]|nr:RNA-binding protein [Cytophagales bacterium]
MPKKLFPGLLPVLLLGACQSAPPAADTLFSLMPAGYTGVDFANTLSLDESFDVFRYRNYYNGGGVALGDVNNDGLTDIYLTANMLPNRLFLNQGNWQFIDATETAGVAGTKTWATG